jgi:hypothetical protein
MAREFLETHLPKDLSNLVMDIAVNKPFYFQYKDSWFIYNFETLKLKKIRGSFEYDDSKQFAQIDNSYYRCIDGIPEVKVLEFNKSDVCYFGHSIEYGKIKSDEGIVIDLPHNKSIDFEEYNFDTELDKIPPLPNSYVPIPFPSYSSENKDENEDEVKILPKISQLHDPLEMEYSVINCKTLYSLRTKEILLQLPEFIDRADYCGRGTFSKENQIYNIWTGKLYTFDSLHRVLKCMDNTIILYKYESYIYNLETETYSFPFMNHYNAQHDILIHGGLYVQSNYGGLINLYPEEFENWFDISFLNKQENIKSMGTFSSDGNVYANVFISGCDQCGIPIQGIQDLQLNMSLLIYDLTSQEIVVKHIATF